MIETAVFRQIRKVDDKRFFCYSSRVYPHPTPAEALEEPSFI